MEENLEKRPEKRYRFGPDLVRVTAAVMSFVLHFYWNNGFYFQPVTTVSMFAHVMLRDIAFCCVPLFLMLTGYLKCGKEWKKGYYRSLLPIMISWLLISLLSSFYHMTAEKKQWTLLEWFTQITDYQAASYSWYVNMYFGIFLLSPFINAAWNRIGTKENHQRLLLAAMLITCIPYSVNVLLLTLPDYWTYLWPFTYYLMGCYVKTYGLKIRPRKGIPVILAIAAAFTLMNMATGGTNSMTAGHNPGYGSVLCFGLVTVVFCTLIPRECPWERVRRFIRHLAPLSLSMIMISEIFNLLLFTPRYLEFGPDAYFLEGLWRIALSLFASWCVALPVTRLSEKIAGIAPLSQWRTRTRTIVYRAAAAAALLGAFGFILWKTRYGFGNVDEAFYLTIPLRLCRGDALLAHEWHISQLSSLLLYPLMRLYLLFFDGTEGIVLHFRLLYTCVHAIASVFLYFRWKRLSLHGALPAALLFMLYAPFGIMAFSYNSLGILCMTLALTLIVTAKHAKGWQQLAAGVLFAGAVLCCPALAAVWALYAAGVLLCRIVPALRRRTRETLLSGMPFARVTAGCALLLAALAAQVLTRASMDQVLRSLPFILQDPEHPAGSLGIHLSWTLQGLMGRTDGMTGLSALFGAVLLAAALDRKKKWAPVWWLCGCADAVGLMVLSLPQNQLINAIAFPLALLAPLSLLLVRERRMKTLFFAFWLPAMLYAFCIAAISNQTYLAAQTGLIVASACALLMAGMTTAALYRREENVWYQAPRRAALAVCFVLLCGSFLGVEGYRRCERVFWEDGIASQTALIASGPEAGLMVTPAMRNYYEAVQADMENIRAEHGDAESAAILTSGTWYYLFLPWEYGTYSAWPSGSGEQITERLLAYWDISPEKQPDLILVDRTQAIDAERLAEEMAYQPAGESAYFTLLRRP